MTGRELFQSLLLMIEKKGYIVKECDLDGGAANISCKYHFCVYDSNIASAFTIAHEYIHAINKDFERTCDNDICNPSEIRANKDAVTLLWDMFLDNGGSYDFFNNFVDIIECPFDLAYDIISKQYNNQENELNEMDSRRDIDDIELTNCITDYISTLDAVDEINIYGFLEIYSINYTFYERASKIFRDIVKGDLYQSA